MCWIWLNVFWLRGNFCGNWRVLCLSEVLANLFEIMSYEEFKFLVGLVDLLVGVFFFFVSTFLYRETVLVKACLYPPSQIVLVSLYETSRCSVDVEITT